ncbi:PE-PPE domain-containing protein [Mycolicibacter heraklionensis]|uniref:PE-PPE domain-containing protein n=1 Tax=Mycolicibacter heraklionensis TaxID=512402 RepID=UPI000699DF2B|nr:PE-PPE domain-containing protein [Mycolicibacter heraklionensis]
MTFAPHPNGPIRAGLRLAAAAGIGLLALTATISVPFAYADDVTLVLGGTGLSVPNPPPGFIIGGTDKFVTPNFPGFTSAHAQGVYTPEQLYPLTGVSSLTLNQSVAAGANTLNNAILRQIAEGNHVVVLTDSQSSVVAGEVMRLLAALPADQQPSADALGFVLLVDPNNPNGGLFARYPDLAFPALGVTFNGATPPDTIYPTAVYTLEYDGASDYPQYPINILADLNAIAGFLFVHPTAGNLTPEQIASAIELPTDPAYGTATTYYMVPTENLPLLEPLRALPIIGNPLADLIQPDLRVLVNLGYGDPDFGYSTGPANVPTPAGFLPNVDLIDLLTDLVKGAQQGWNDAFNSVTFEALGSNFAAAATGSPLDILTGVTGITAPPVPVPTIIPGDTVGNIISVVQALGANTFANLTLALGVNAAAFLPPVQMALEAVTTLPSVNINAVLSAVDALAGGDVAGFISTLGAIPGEDITIGLFAALVFADDILNAVAADLVALQGAVDGGLEILSAVVP